MSTEAERQFFIKIITTRYIYIYGYESHRLQTLQKGTENTRVSQRKIVKLFGTNHTLCNHFETLVFIQWC